MQTEKFKNPNQSFNFFNAHMNTYTVILDGYVDEPACLGVPPYISPYVRYIAGALRDCGVGEWEIHYITIDNLRTDPQSCIPYLDHAGLIIIIAGMTVPGKYLGGTPITCLL